MRISDWSSDVCSSDLRWKAGHCDRIVRMRRPRDVSRGREVLQGSGRADACGRRGGRRLRGNRTADPCEENRHGQRPVRAVVRVACDARVDPGRIVGRGGGGMNRARRFDAIIVGAGQRSEEHTSELQQLLRISYAVLFLTKQEWTSTSSTEIYR